VSSPRKSCSAQLEAGIRRRLGLRRTVRGLSFGDNDGVVGAVEGALLLISLEFVAVRVEDFNLFRGAGIPYASVIDEDTLVHQVLEDFDSARVSVNVEAARGELGTGLNTVVAAHLGVLTLHDALRVVYGSVGKGGHQPVDLHVGDVIRELTDEKSRHHVLREASRFNEELLSRVRLEGHLTSEEVSVESTFGNVDLARSGGGSAEESNDMVGVGEGIRIVGPDSVKWRGLHDGGGDY